MAAPIEATYGKAMIIGLIAWLFPIGGSAYFISQGGSFTSSGSGNGGAMAVLVRFNYFYGLAFAIFGLAMTLSVDQESTNRSRRAFKLFAYGLNGLYLASFFLWGTWDGSHQ